MILMLLCKGIKVLCPFFHLLQVKVIYFLLTLPESVPLANQLIFPSLQVSQCVPQSLSVARWMHLPFLLVLAQVVRYGVQLVVEWEADWSFFRAAGTTVCGAGHV